MSFDEPKIFIVKMSTFSLFLLRLCFWCHMLKKYFLFNPKALRFSHIFSSGGFTHLGFTFWPVIHFEWIFTHDVGTCTEFFFFCMWVYNCSRTFCWKSYPLLTDLLCTLWKISFPCICGSTSSDLFCSTNLYVYININVTLCWLL